MTGAGSLSGAGPLLAGRGHTARIFAELRGVGVPVIHFGVGTTAILPDLAGAKSDLQTRHAAAKAAYEAKVAKAKDEYNTITEVIDQQLYGITTTLEILTRAQDELTKAELPR